MPDTEEDIPFLAIGNEELGDPIPDEIVCPHCEGLHTIEYGTQEIDGKHVPSKLLAFYQCGSKSYLAGINGRLWKGNT